MRSGDKMGSLKMQDYMSGGQCMTNNNMATTD